jgi:hypothetical protein
MRTLTSVPVWLLLYFEQFTYLFLHIILFLCTTYWVFDTTRTAQKTLHRTTSECNVTWRLKASVARLQESWVPRNPNQEWLYWQGPAAMYPKPTPESRNSGVRTDGRCWATAWLTLSSGNEYTRKDTDSRVMSYGEDKWGSGGIASPFLTLTLERNEWSVTRPGRFIPGEKSADTHWIRGWMGPRAGLDAVEKRNILHYWESNPGVQPAARRYTDWTNPAQLS